MSVIKKYLFYLFRWQLSTPILAVVIWWLADLGSVTVTIIANLIGGLIFFWVDRMIFRTRFLNPLWEIKDDVVCHDCGRECKGYRLVKAKNYDKLNDTEPQFRCQKCSRKKTVSLRKRGVEV